MAVLMSAYCVMAVYSSFSTFGISLVGRYPIGGPPLGLYKDPFFYIPGMFDK